MEAREIAQYAGAALIAGFAGFVWIGLIALIHDIIWPSDDKEPKA